MAVRLPKEIRESVRVAVYRQADESGYMYKGRAANGDFMESLLHAEDVGVVLADFMERGKIRTYIKDAVLNRYMKEKKTQALDQSELVLPVAIRDHFRQDVYFVERQKSVTLYRLEDGRYLVVSQGTFLKWETALRRALEFIERAPGLPPDNVPVEILLYVAMLGNAVTAPDREHLENALRYLGVGVVYA